MKMTNGLIDALLTALNQEEFITKATKQTGYAIYRNIRILSEENKDYTKMIEDILKKHGKQNENGGYYIDQNDKDAIEAFYKELIPVSNMVVDVDLYQIDKANFDLPYCETATPQQYALIEECLVKPEKHNDESSENKTDKDSKNEDK